MQKAISLLLINLQTYSALWVANVLVMHVRQSEITLESKIQAQPIPEFGTGEKWKENKQN